VSAVGAAVGKGGLEMGESGGELELDMGVWVELEGVSGEVEIGEGGEVFDGAGWVVGGEVKVK
jgi:hypothetical protein